MKAYGLYEQLDDKEGLANTLLSLALVHQGMKDKEKAVDFAIQAANIANELEHKKILSRAHTNLCSIYHNFDRTDSALYHGKIALQMSG